MDNDALLRWVEENNIKTKTIENFWNAFNNYKEDLTKEELERYFEGYDEKHLKLWFRSVSQRAVFLDYYDKSNKNLDVIEACIEIIYKNTECYGTYSAFYDFSGNITDDSLDCEWEKWYINMKKDILEEFKIEFSDKAIKEGIDPKVASKIVSSISAESKK